MDEKVILEKENEDYKTIDLLSKSFYKLLLQFDFCITENGHNIKSITDELDLRTRRNPFNAKKVITKIKAAMKFENNVLREDKSLIVLLFEVSALFDNKTFEKLNTTIEGVNVVDLLPRSVFDVLNKLEEIDMFLEYSYKNNLFEKEANLHKYDEQLKNKVVAVSKSCLINNDYADFRSYPFEENDININKELTILNSYSNLYKNYIQSEIFEDSETKQYALEKIDEIKEYTSFLNKEKLKVIK